MFARVVTGTVVEFRKTLPTVVNNITGFHLLDQADQIANGWYPVIDLQDGEPTGEVTWEILSDHVTRNWINVEIPFIKIKTDICSEIDRLRDRNIDAGFTWRGHTFQSRSSDRENIMGAAQAAQFAMMMGATPGNYRWAGGDSDFVWITTDNQLIPLDVYDAIQLFQRGVSFKSAQTFYARALKDAIMACVTLEQVKSIDVYNGWPK